MSNTLLLKRSGTAAAVPLAANIALGELAINYADGNLFYKDSGGTVKVIASNQFSSVVGNVTGGNINTSGLVSATGNITGGNLNTAGNVTGNYILGNISQATGYSASKIYNGLSEANIGAANSNLTVSINGSADVAVFATTGVYVTGVTSASGNVTGGNILTGGLISATSNINGGNLISAALVQGVTVSASGNVVSGNVATGGLITATGNITGANVATAGLVSATGNITGGNITTAGNVNAPIIKNGSTGIYLDAGYPGYINFFNGTANPTVTISDTGSLTATGNIVGANVTTGGLISATANITGGNVLTGGLISATGNITGGIVNTNTLNGTNTTIKSAGNINLSATGNIILSTATYINNLSTPVQDADAANKGYVDAVAQGLDIKASVVWATVAALPAYTYNNGTSGVGATLTGNAVGALSIDGNAVSATERVLVKNETATNAPYNGIYVVTNAGSGGAAYVLTRATDFDNGTPSGEMPGAFTFVEDGTIADTGWVCTTNAPITVGTTDITFVQFSGAGSYIAGTGLTLTGSTFSVNASQTQVTAVGTLGSLSVTGSTTSGNLLTGGNVSATGNVTGGNVLTGGLISATGNITGGNIMGGANVNATTHTGATVSVTGNITGGNVISSGLVQGATVSATGNVIAGNIVTTGSSGNITGANVISATTLSATANVNGGNVISSALVQGVTVSASGNVVGGNVTTAGLISATGNVNGGNLIGAALVQGVTVSASGNVVGGNVTTAGLLSATGNITSAGNIAGGNVLATTAMYVGGISVLTVNSTVDGGTY